MNIVKLQGIKLIQRNPLNETEREIEETILFTIATKRIKYLGIYLPKEIKKKYIESTIKHWGKKSNTTQMDGEIYHVLRLEK